MVLDRNLSLSPDLHLFKSAGKTIIITEKRETPLESEGITYICLTFGGDLIPALLEELYKRNIGILLVEGGAFTLNEFIRQGYYQELRVFQTHGNIKNGISSPSIKELPDMVQRVDTDELRVWLKEKG